MGETTSKNDSANESFIIFITILAVIVVIFFIVMCWVFFWNTSTTDSYIEDSMDTNNKNDDYFTDKNTKIIGISSTSPSIGGSTTNPTVSTTNPIGGSTTNPTVSNVNPIAGSTTNPTVSTTNPTVSTTNPTVSTTNPTVSTTNPISFDTQTNINTQRNINPLPGLCINKNIFDTYPVKTVKFNDPIQIDQILINANNDYLYKQEQLKQQKVYLAQQEQLKQQQAYLAQQEQLKQQQAYLVQQEQLKQQQAYYIQQERLKQQLYYDKQNQYPSSSSSSLYTGSSSSTSSSPINPPKLSDYTKPSNVIQPSSSSGSANKDYGLSSPTGSVYSYTETVNPDDELDDYVYNPKNAAEGNPQFDDYVSSMKKNIIC